MSRSKRKTVKPERPGDGCWLCLGKPRRFLARDVRRTPEVEDWETDLGLLRYDEHSKREEVA